MDVRFWNDVLYLFIVRSKHCELPGDMPILEVTVL